MSIDENLKQIEATLAAVGKLGASYMGEKVYGQLSRSEESLAAIREHIAAQDDLVREHYRAYDAQIAALEKTPTRIKLATMEKERDEAEDVARVMTEETRVLRKRIATLEAAAKERDARGGAVDQLPHS